MTRYAVTIYGSSVPNEANVRLASFKAASRQITSKPLKAVILAEAKADSQARADYAATLTELYANHGIDAEVLDQPGRQLRSANILDVAGGETGRLLDFIARHALLPYISRAAARGMIIVGHSAGLVTWFTHGHITVPASRDRALGQRQYDLIDCTALLPGSIACCAHADEPVGANSTRESDFSHRLNESNLNGLALYDDAAVLIEGTSIECLQGHVRLHLHGHTPRFL